jgi:phenylacetate-CoA ligase
LPVTVELTEGTAASAGLAEEMQRRIREKLFITTVVTLVPAGTLPRSSYKSRLVDWPASPSEGAGP